MNELLEKLFKGKEGNILLLAVCLIFFLTLFIIVSYFIDVSYANKITGIVFSNLLVGRVPALSFGYTAELSHFSVISINVVTEMILVTTIYPLFVFSFKGILRVKVLEDFFNQVKLKKQQHQEKFDRYGKFGLFVFVFIPFWMTGPIVGSIIGFLIGLKHYTIIAIVFISTVIAITLWALFLQEIIDALMLFDSQILWIVLFIIVFGLLIFRFKDLIYDKITKIMNKENE